MLRFTLPRTARRPTKNPAQTVQRKGVWVAMILLMFVVLFGGTKWREQKDRLAAPADEGMVDNVITPPQVKPAEKLIMPGDLKVPEAKPMFAGEGKRLFGGVSSSVFEPVEDDAVFRAAENNAFFTLLKALQDSDARDVELASIGRKTFVQLYKQSDEYRGEIVTVGGTIVRVIPQSKPLANKQGIEKYYEVWFVPDGSRMPMAAEVLELPDYPAGTKPAFDLSGFFYKRLGYASQETAAGNADETGMKNVFRSSPLLLAKTLKLRPVAATAAVAPADDGPAFLSGVPLPFPSKYVLPVLGAGMIVLVAVSAWAFRLMRTPLMAAGPIMGRRRDPEQVAEVTNLNSLNIES